MGPPATPCCSAQGGFFPMQNNVGQTQQEMLDATSPRPDVPWALVLLIVWCAVEATIFTVTLRPTMSELLSDLTGYQVNPIALVLVLWFFLTIIDRKSTRLNSSH